MIHAFTGQPGAAKTLNLMKFVCEDKGFILWAVDEAGNVINGEDGKPVNLGRRQVYYYGLKEVTIDGWIELSLEEVLRWWELPEGSVIIIDEVQKVMRARPLSKVVPKHVEHLETSRHLGMDFLWTFQFPKQIDSIAIEMINYHYHYHRALGLESSTRYTWQELCMNPKSKVQQEKAEISIVPFPKKYYGTYKSSSLHTEVKRIPWKVYLIIPAAMFLIYFAYLAYGYYVSYRDGTIVEDISGDGVSGVTGVVESLNYRKSNTVERDDMEQYIWFRTPRIKDDPSSAPMYDDVRKAISYPRLNCVSRVVPVEGLRHCGCYNQQGKRESVSRKQCLYYIEKGFKFDPALPDDALRRSGEASSEPSGSKVYL